MSLTTQQRSTLFDRFKTVIGTEEAGILLDQFPAGEGDELVTKDHLDRELALVRLDLARLENRMYVTIVGVSTVATGIILAVGR